MDCRKALLQWAVKRAGDPKRLADCAGLPLWAINRYLANDVAIPDAVFLKLVDFALDEKLATHDVIPNSHR